MVHPKSIPQRGILHVRLVPGQPGYRLFWPSKELAPFVEHFWTVSWDLDVPQTAETLPYPSVQLALEVGRSHVLGIPMGRFTRHLAGRGCVLGTKFRPGGFRAFLDGPVSALTGREVPLVEVFGGAAQELEASALDEDDPLSAFECVERSLLALEPRPDPEVDLVATITARIETERDITRVSQLEECFGLGARSLQRLFAEYVGVGPKWVIQRYRLHEAADRIAEGGDLDWPDLSLQLGYADQAHFIRDFRRLVGRSPAAYAKNYHGAGTTTWGLPEG